MCLCVSERRRGGGVNKEGKGGMTLKINARFFIFYFLPTLENS